MKRLFLILLFAIAAISARAQGTAYLPAGKTWSLAWDMSYSQTNVLSFDLFYGTNRVATLAPANYSTAGFTNGLQTLSAVVPGLPEGTNAVTLVAVDPAGTRSDPSLPLTAIALPKPSAPQNPRKL